MLNRCDYQLRDARTARNDEQFGTSIDQNDLQFSAIVGIDRPGRVEHCDAVASGQTRPRPDLALAALGQSDRDARWNHGAAAGRNFDRRIGRHRGHEIEAGGERALILRQRQIAPMRQLDDAHLDGRLVAHRSASSSAVAIRAIKARATSSFDCGGQDSTPAAVIKWIVLTSPPMMPVAGETSLARIQSQPFLASFAWALAMTLSVSAAKPMTSRGRPELRCAIVDRMSGFSVSARVGVLPGCFLILLSLGRSARQSATAAANTATSAGSACSTALSICCAVSTFTTDRPGGSGRLTGPDTSTPSAPAAAAAAAMAWPCLPEERLAI